MPFDLTTAKPVTTGGFDLSTATPVVADVPKSPLSQKPLASLGFLDRIGRDVEPWITAGTSALATPFAGWAGILSGGDADVVRKTQDALTYHPITQGGQQGLEALGNAVGSFGKTLATPVQTGLGDINPISRYMAGSDSLADAGQPGLATLHNLLPQALALFGTGGASDALTSVAKGLPGVVAKAPSAIVGAGDTAAEAIRARFGKTDIPVRPTDFPPVPADLRPTVVPPKPSVPVAPKPLDPSRPALFQMDPPAPSYISQPEVAARPFDPSKSALFQNIAEDTVPDVVPPAAPATAPFASAPPLPVTANDRAARADILRSIGLNPEQHPSAVTGDKKIAGQEFQESKLLGPVGDARKAVVDLEQTALRDNGDKLIASTGGTPNVSPDTRGHAIVAPLNGLRDYFETQINNAYTDARATAGDLAAVQPDRFHALLQDPDFRSTLLSSQDGTSLLGQVDAQAGRFAGLTPDGVAPVTVNDAEKMRQWLNSVSKPSNSTSVSALKQALDLDVAQTGGDDTFKFARDLYGIKKDTLDNPNGIASILNEEGPDGVNRRVPFEKVPAKIVEMPNAQFQHVVTTLQNVPAELQPQAQQALAEIKAQMVERMVNAGSLNGQANVSYRANAFTKSMQDLQDKLPMLFSDEDIAALKLHNDAAHILHRDKSYPGAEVQKQNLAVRGATAALPAVGGAAGAVFGPAGAGLGAGVGGMAAGAVNKFADINKAKAILKGVPLDQLVGK